MSCVVVFNISSSSLSLNVSINILISDIRNGNGEDSWATNNALFFVMINSIHLYAYVHFSVTYTVSVKC